MQIRTAPSKKLFVLTTLIGALFSSSLLANGFLPYCMNAKMCQMGGAGVAETTLGSTAGNVNPALMGYAGRDLALEPLVLFQNEHINSSKTQLTNGTPLPPYTRKITNTIKTYPAGYTGFNYDMNPKLSAGFATAGGGNNAKYKKSIISPALSAPRKLQTMAGLLSSIVAFKPTCDQSYGLALIVGYLQMKNNLTQFPSGIPTKGANRTDWGFGVGARIGGQWNANQFLSFGLAASSPVIFQKLKKYNDVMKHHPQIPPIVTGGLVVHARKDTDVLFDLEGLFWKGAAATGKWPPNGQGWRNILVFKFGVQHAVMPDLKLRMGYNFGQTPIRSNAVLFNALSEVITVCEHIITAGFSHDITKTMSFDLGGAYLFNRTLKDNGKGPAGLAAKGLTVQARAIMVSLGFTLKY